MFVLFRMQFKRLYHLIKERTHFFAFCQTRLKRTACKCVLLHVFFFHYRTVNSYFYFLDLAAYLVFYFC